MKDYKNFLRKIKELELYIVEFEESRAMKDKLC